MYSTSRDSPSELAFPTSSGLELVPAGTDYIPEKFDPNDVVSNLDIQITVVCSTSSYDLLEPNDVSESSSDLVSITSGTTSHVSYVHSSKGKGDASWNTPKYISAKFPIEGSMGEEAPTWKSTILNRKDVQTARENAMKELKATFDIKTCPCCESDILGSLELFSISTVLMLEYLNSVSHDMPSSLRVLEDFVLQLGAWKCYTFPTMLRHIDKIKSLLDYLVVNIDTHSEFEAHSTWPESINRAIAQDIEELARVLSDIMEEGTAHRDASSYELSCLVDGAQLAISQHNIDTKPLERLLRHAAEKHGILPKSIFMRGISRIGDNPVHGGGFADVWKGELNGSFLALKVLRIFSLLESQKLQKDFSKEATLWRRLQHPNVLPFLGICQDIFTPRLALVSEWMENGNLVHYLKNTEAVDCVQVLRGVAMGLEYLHTIEPKIVHGDLRAANILIDSSHKPRITDFGLARTVIVDSQGTYTMSSFDGRGTLRWQAPELLNSSRAEGGHVKLTVKSDVYAFGCVCLEVFTGSIPFAMLYDWAVIMEVVIHDRRPPKPDTELAVQRGFDGRFWELMQLCWKTRACERPDISWVSNWFDERVNGPTPSN